MKFFFLLFCRNRNHLVPRACNTRFFENHIWFGRDIRLLNVSTHAQHAIKSVPRMLSQRWNSFRVCSVCDEIRSPYAQHKFTCKNCSHFTAGWAYVKIHSSYAQCAMKSFPRMLSVRWNRFRVCSAYACYNFRKLLKKSLIKMQISAIKNKNFEKPSRNPYNRTKVKI